ncbi:MAG TPA: ABC transporter permease, partial [Opitutaceae bacterium]|nr:ABC transporter permease [Opitutaceae bacterium]
MRALFARIRDLFRRRHVDEAFREEMAFHKAELVQRHRERGLSVDEAHWAAEREFGNSLHVREALREQSGFRVWDNVSGDFHYAWRVIGRRPGFGLSVILILAVGLTAAATLHGLIDAVFLRSLPVQAPQELRAVTVSGRSDPAIFSRGTVDRWIAQQPPGSIMAFTGAGRGTVQAGTRPVERVRTRLVVGSSLKTLGVNPRIGRGLTEQDDRIGSPAAVAVVAAKWAQQTFGQPADALHREVLVNRVPVTIVGVLPTSFRDVAVGEATDIWLPASLQFRLRMYGNSRTASGDDRENHADWNQEERVSWLRVMFRSRGDDKEAMTALRRAWEPERESITQTLSNPEERQHLQRTAWESVPSPSGQSRFRDEFRKTGQLLVGVVTVMLILVCANVSGLLMVRSMARHREIGVRLALGASGWRVARLAVMEALLLSCIGGGVAWVAASWLLPLAVRMLAPGMDLEAELGTRTILFMWALAVGCALASALGPAVWISRTRPLTAISGNLGLSQAPIRFSRILVVAQFTVAVVLVAAATNLGNVLRQTLQADHGFDRTQVLTAQFDAETAGYTRGEVPGVLTRVEDTLLAVPGVERVSFSSSGILVGSHSSSGVFARDGRAKGVLEY